MKQQLLPLAFLASLSLSASAAVTVVAAISSIDNQANPQGSGTVASFDPAGGTKLIVMTSAEGNGGSAEIDNITFGGTPLISAGIDVVGGRGTAIWYLDNPTGTGDIVANYNSNVNGVGFSVISITGAALGGPEATASANDLPPTGNSVSLTSLTDDAFLVATYAGNAGGNATTATLQSGQTQLLSSGDIGSAVGASGYGVLGAAGVQSVEFTGGRTDGQAALSAAVFPMIPEPSTALLSALSVLGLLRRRR